MFDRKDKGTQTHTQQQKNVAEYFVNGFLIGPVDGQLIVEKIGSFQMATNRNWTCRNLFIHFRIEKETIQW